MEITQHIQLKEAHRTIQYSVERRHAWPSDFDAWHAAHSYCLVCPSCTKVWATVRCDNEALCYPIAGFCLECEALPQHWLDGIRGSILVEEGLGNIDLPLLDALPEELLRREFHLHLRAFREMKEFAENEPSPAA